MSTTSKDGDEFWDFLRKNANDLEHRRNLAGKTTQLCASCKGSGHSEPSRIDYDAHGSYWVEPVHCRSCGGAGRTDVACSAEVEAAAIRVEIKRHQARLRELRKVSAR